MRPYRNGTKLMVVLLAALIGLSACQSTVLTPADAELFKDSEK